jgi:hypothetical protein
MEIQNNSNTSTEPSEVNTFANPHPHKNKKNILFKLVLILLCAAFWMTYRLLYLKDQKRDWNYPYCFNDKFVSQVLVDFTRYLSQHWYLRNFLIVSSACLMDVFFISFIIVYIMKSNSWKHILHFGVFYGIRNAFVQGTFLLEIYDTYLWGFDAGFPSISVPLNRAADFFYSGHAGSALVLGIQYKELGYGELLYVSIFISLYEAFVLCATRGHYGIDIVFGILMAHYSYFLSTPLGEFLDKYVPICGIKEDSGVVSTHSSNENNKIEINTDRNLELEQIEQVVQVQ